MVNRLPQLCPLLRFEQLADGFRLRWERIEKLGKEILGNAFRATGDAQCLGLVPEGWRLLVGSGGGAANGLLSFSPG